ncbi:uncharacterized protein PGTG_17341 [Puccinia graminis f. sp. tritici CRL 75-36-700-3]|uniref:Uncharacterized protein n=1 Tax=Puccinia graminis f. sp. tritici (strain CRL 75-36-700-3 / race SCCL) TaxID=418459 RepID=E3L4B0_PUCGT|nr:uncharacterized protein PGTG_17341 [Puccinia graminis f. sp. tritici CRL 75-36-700-3]EFP91385.2 hypothetical protein PGTG_17341 [Puccinia graminis f. sp. tritici CRL 75-36-700-3]
MGFSFNCPCLCWPTQRNQQQQQHQQEQQQPLYPHSEADADERTPLIVNPPQVTPSPSLPVIDTAQQQADEAAANKIVSQTVRCLVDVYSQAPFSHLKIRGAISASDSISDLPHTPDGVATAWRAYDPPSCPPVSSETSKYQLSASTNFQSPSTNHGHQTAPSKRSFHSLKTIINHQNRSLPDEHDTRLSASLIDLQQDPAHRLSSSSTLPGSTHASTQFASQRHSRDNSFAPTSCSTQFDTIRTFQTARDHPNLNNDDDEDDPDPTEDLTLTTSQFPINNHLNGDLDPPPPPLLASKPDFVTRLWDQSDHQEPPHESEESPANLSDQTSCQTDPTDLLTDDPKKLAEMIANGFRLTDTGPILVEL